MASLLTSTQIAVGRNFCHRARVHLPKGLEALPLHIAPILLIVGLNCIRKLSRSPPQFDRFRETLRLSTFGTCIGPSSMAPSLPRFLIEHFPVQSNTHFDPAGSLGTLPVMPRGTDPAHHSHAPPSRSPVCDLTAPQGTRAHSPFEPHPFLSGPNGIHRRRRSAT